MLVGPHELYVLTLTTEDYQAQASRQELRLVCPELSPLHGSSVERDKGKDGFAHQNRKRPRKGPLFRGALQTIKNGSDFPIGVMCPQLAVHVPPDSSLAVWAAEMGAAIRCSLVGDFP
jgi:hypothetical protein